METPVNIYKRPRLRNPQLIIGWSDAGFVGTRAVDYLVEKLGAEQFAEIEPQEFSLLPHCVIKGGILEEVSYPGNSFYYWKNKNSVNDLIIFGGRTPEVNHYEFASLMLDVANLFKVSRIYTVGSIYGNISHNAVPRIFGVINNASLRRHVAHPDVEFGLDYQGPTSMNGLILGIAKDSNIDAINLVGQVPSYLGNLPNPQVCEIILRILVDILPLDIDLSAIEQEARQARKQTEEMVNYFKRKYGGLNQQIIRLDSGMGKEISEEERQKFFNEIEEFLRQQKSQEEND